MPAFSESDWYTCWSDSRFWQKTDPRQHFDTPSTLCPDGLAEIALAHSAKEPAVVIDVGADSGRLLAAVGRLLPDAERIGIDQRGPGIHDPDSHWMRAHWDTREEVWSGDVAATVERLCAPVLLLACEWLDDLPTPVLRRPSEIRNLTAADRAWLERWWPAGRVRAVGRTRDLAWAWWAGQLPAGSTMIALDYGHVLDDRPAEGGFTAYRAGRQVAPDPELADELNLTAAVAMDSLSDALECRGVRRIALTRLVDLDASPTRGGGLAALAVASQHATLRDPDRFGTFWLAAHKVDGQRPRTAARLGTMTR